MIDYSFPLEELEYYLLILVRVSAFIFVAPFFGMNTIPRIVKAAFSCFIAMVIYATITPHIYPAYTTIFEYAIVVMKEAIVGLLVGLGAQFCMLIVSFAGHIVDTEIGFGMAQLFDPASRMQVTITGMLYQYTFFLLFLVTGMYTYLLTALSETFTLIPVGQAQLLLYDIYNAFLDFMSNFLIIGFRIALPIFGTTLLLNSVLGIMAKVSPQMNMFAVGLQIKVLVGLIVLYLTCALLPVASNFIFRQMKVMIVTFVKALGGG